MIPKKTPGKWRIIVDLSSPKDASVNDATRRQYTHLAYLSVDDTAHAMHHLGRESLMAKIDVKEAYKIIPVHPEDRSFLAVCWRDSVFVDCQLPFGLASAQLYSVPRGRPWSGSYDSEECGQLWTMLTISFC